MTGADTAGEERDTPTCKDDIPCETGSDSLLTNATDLEKSNKMSNFWTYYNYNYIAQNQNFSDLVTSATLSIDYFRLFILDIYLPRLQISPFIYNHFHDIQPMNKQKTKFSFIHRVGAQDRAGYILPVIKGNYCLGSILALHDPDIVAAQHIHSILAGKYSVNAVEYVVDLFGPDVDNLFRALKLRIAQRWKRTAMDNKYDTTHYLSNVRKAKAIGMRMYQKYRDEECFVRIEAMAKRDFFSRHQCKTVMTALSFDPAIIFSQISFKGFDFIKFYKSYAKSQGVDWNIYNLDPAVRDHHLNNLRKFQDKFFRQLSANDILSAAKEGQNLVGKDCLVASPLEEQFRQLISGKSFV